MKKTKIDVTSFRKALMDAIMSTRDSSGILDPAIFCAIEDGYCWFGSDISGLNRHIDRIVLISFGPAVPEDFADKDLDPNDVFESALEEYDLDDLQTVFEIMLYDREYAGEI